MCSSEWSKIWPSTTRAFRRCGAPTTAPKVKRNERVNVLKLANAQTLTNMEQRLHAQCADLKQRQRTGEVVHSQRMKMLTFSHVGMASAARNRNAVDLEVQRKDTKAKRRAQQHRVDAAKQRHHKNIEGEEARHGQAMSDMKSTSDAKTAKHNGGDEHLQQQILTG